MRFQTGIFKHFGIILGKTVVNYIVIIDVEGMNGDTRIGICRI